MINNQMKNEVISLANYLLERDLGTTLSYHEMDELLSCDIPSTEFNTIIKDLNHELIKHNTYLDETSGIGYSIIGFDGLLNTALTLSQQGINNVIEAANIILNIDLSIIKNEDKLKLYLVAGKIFHTLRYI